MLTDRMDPRDDRGSIMPLILGFWLIGLYVVAASIALGDAFTAQRDLQSICDGAALAAANSVEADLLHYGGPAAASLPLADTTAAVGRFLARDGGRSGVAYETTIDADTVTVRCRRTNRITFGVVIGRRDGIEQVVYSSARSPLVP